MVTGLAENLSVICIFHGLPTSFLDYYFFYFSLFTFHSFARHTYSLFAELSLEIGNVVYGNYSGVISFGKG